MGGSVKMLILLILSAYFLPAHANVDSNLVFFGIEDSSRRVLQCPASNDALKDFRKKLYDLKNSIKSDAENCKGLRADVDGLADLVTTKRENFINLVTKGQVEGLSRADQNTIENYVSELTIKTSNLISVLAGEDACFDEDKKGMSLDFLTSLIGEGAKILSVLGGPEIAGTVQIAGEVISGFINAVKVINANEQGYNFKKADQRIAYAESLCSLFEYRRELDALMNPYETAERLMLLTNSLNRQLSVLNRSCVECSQLIREVDAETALASRNGLVEIQEIDEVWSKSFEEKIALRALEIDQLYTKKLGTQTYRALKTRTWLPIRARTVESSGLTADLGLEDVLSEIDNIERFMLDRQASKFISQLTAEAKDWKDKIVYHLMEGEFLLLDLGFGQPFYEVWETRRDRVGIILEALETGANEAKDSRKKSVVKTFFRDLERLSKSLNVAVDVAQKYCAFFENSGWYNTQIMDTCASNRLQNLSEDAVLYTNYRLLMPSYKGPEFVKRPVDPYAEVEVSADWVESLTLSVNDMMKKPNYVVRQPGQASSSGPLR
jgi:hypothetical protein